MVRKNLEKSGKTWKSQGKPFSPSLISNNYGGLEPLRGELWPLPLHTMKDVEKIFSSDTDVSFVEGRTCWEEALNLEGSHWGFKLCAPPELSIRTSLERAEMEGVEMIPVTSAYIVVGLLDILIIWIFPLLMGYELWAFKDGKSENFPGGQHSNKVLVASVR